MTYSIVFECAGFKGTLTRNPAKMKETGKLSVDVHVMTPSGHLFDYDNGDFQVSGIVFDEPRLILSLLNFLTMTPESGISMQDLTPDERDWHESRMCATLAEIFQNDDIENDIVYNSQKSSLDWDVYMVDGDVMLKMRKEFANDRRTDL